MLAGQRFYDGIEESISLGDGCLRGHAADGVRGNGHGQVGHAQ